MSPSVILGALVFGVLKIYATLTHKKTKSTKGEKV